MAKNKNKKETSELHINSDHGEEENGKFKEIGEEKEENSNSEEPVEEENRNSESGPELKPAKSESDLPLINLTVYCNLSGLKFDQIAGFRRYAINQKLGPMTVPQWREEYNGFLAKPMR